MKTKTIYTLLLSFIFTLMCCLSANGQLKYVDGKLTLDTAPESGYKITLASNGMYLKLPSQNNFFQIDISPTNTRLAGHNNQIAFYNTQTSTFNSINVMNVYYYSDARAKTNIQNFNKGKSVISQLRPVTYNFINEGKSLQRSSNQEIGLLAQELEAILPGAVITDGEGNKLINYNALIPVLIDAVQSLQTEVQSLQLQLNALK